MKTVLTMLILIALVARGFAEDELENYRRNTEAIWRTGCGAEDGTFTAIATSMFAWGIGLAVGIAILASVLHQSSAGHSHTSCHNDPCK